MKTSSLKLSILALALLINLTLRSQTEGVSIKGSASPPDPSAMLDVASSNKGLLAPRLSLSSITSASPVASPTTGLLVFNLATNTPSANTSWSVTPGFYYWHSNQWNRLSNDIPPGLWKLDPTTTSTLGIYRTGSVTVGQRTISTPTSTFSVFGPAIFCAAGTPTGSEIYTDSNYGQVFGLHIGEPTTGNERKSNQINSWGRKLELNFTTGTDVGIGRFGGSNLEVRDGSAYNPSSTKGNIAADGTVSAQNAQLTSDSTFKKNITQVSNVLSKVLSLNAYSYNFKRESNSDKKHYGVIAQEVEAQFENLVFTRTDTVYTLDPELGTPIGTPQVRKYMEYQGLTAILLQAIKEQQVQIKALQDRIEFVEQR